MRRYFCHVYLATVAFVAMLVTGCTSAPAASTGAIISGTVLSGGATLAGVTLTLDNGAEKLEIKTDDKGDFTFRNVVAGTRSILLTTTIEGRTCEVTRTIVDLEDGDTVTVDIKLPMQLKPPEAIAAGGIGYVAGDLSIIC